MKRSLWVIWLAVGSGLAAPPAADDVTALLVNRVEEGKKAMGIVAATLDASGTHVYPRGRASADGAMALDGDTVFQIGSITKVFTSLTLADMIERGEVKADDPVEKYLPAGSKVPSRNGKAITLLDLSMQISGLPRMPDNLSPPDATNPYAAYDGKKLLDFLGRVQLSSDPGEKYLYSNFAVGLLGYALAARNGTGYGEMVKKRILEPLGMKSTSVALSADQRSRLAHGYDAGLAPAANWDFDALAGAGAIRSTANDMLKFLAAAMDITDTPLKPAFHRMLSVNHATGVADLDIAMAWHIWRKYGSSIVWHNGGTAGYHSFIGFDANAKRGAVVLCNTFFDIDDIGLHLIDARYPAQKFEPPAPEMKVDPAVLETYTGEYELAPGFSIKVTRDRDHLYAQATNQPRFEVFAAKENEFFLKVVEARITFTKDEGGKVASLTLRQNDKDIPGKKLPQQ
jgi:D-alanyl-D-alanine-carboxypeptidase/D-alanyl-D-alanine-endopeptidase